MTSSDAVPVFDASNSHVFEEGLERDAAANKRTFLDGQLGLVVIFPPVFVFSAYILVKSDLPIWQVAALILFLATMQVVMVVIAIRSFRKPRIHPIRITSEGALALGPRSWELRSLATIETSVHSLTFRDSNGKRILTVKDYQAGDLESFISAVSRVAPGISVRPDTDDMGPHLVRMGKM